MVVYGRADRQGWGVKKNRASVNRIFAPSKYIRMEGGGGVVSVCAGVVVFSTRIFSQF